MQLQSEYQEQIDSTLFNILISYHFLEMKIMLMKVSLLLIQKVNTKIQLLICKVLKKLFQNTYHPYPTSKQTIILFLIVGIICIIWGAIWFNINKHIHTYSIRYDNQCDINSDCTIKLEIPRLLKAPLYIYYELENFHQNQRRYQNSVNYDQLQGKHVDEKTLKEDCKPIVYNKDILKDLNPKVLTFNTKTLNPDDIAYPCGLMAKSIFTDEFKFSSGITINQNDIAWPNEIGKRIKFDNKETATEKYWYNIESESFAIWMRPATFGTFKKLYGKIDQNLEPGTYEIKINNYYDVSEFKGKKNFILTTMGPFGTKNQVLPISFLVLGFVELFIAALFFYKYKSTGGKFGGKFKII